MKTLLRRLFVVVVSIALAVGLPGCQKEEIENLGTIKELYKKYKGGEICSCKYNQQTVYTGGVLNIDGGGEVYDKDGAEIGTCNYAWGQVDPICTQLTDCAVIYRARNNGMGLPAVDLYGLGWWPR